MSLPGRKNQASDLDLALARAIAASTAGDSRAVEEAIADAQEMLMGVGWKVRSWDVEDLVQRFWEKFWKHLPNPDNLSGFAWKVIKNLAISDWRAYGSRQVAVDDPEELVEWASGSDVEMEVVDADTEARLHSAIESLKPNEREVVRLQLDGLKGKEIGEAIGKHESIVSRRLKSARQVIRRKML